MSNYGNYRVLVADRNGLPIAELDVPLSCTWARNEQGSAELSISARYDSKAKREYLKPGNLLIFEHVRLGGWIGVIVPHDGMEWHGSGEILVRAREGIFQFARRRAPLYNFQDGELGVSGSTSAVLRRMIAYANNDEDARLREGAISEVPKLGIYPLNEYILSDVLAKLIKRGKVFVWTTPGRDTNNCFVINVNMVPMSTLEGQGYYPLQEDINIETPSGLFYREDGELVNDAVVRSTDDASEINHHVRKVNERSIMDYGRWQGRFVQSAEEDSTVIAVADKIISDRSELQRKVSIVAIETPESPSTFSSIRVGKMVRVILNSVGFYFGDVGVDLLAQIVAMEYATDENKVILTVEVQQ